jgi:phosphoenolpyruvate carboxykinase (ATP)
VPKHVAGVPDDVLNPRNTWPDKDAYDAQAKKLAGMFRDNFAKFEKSAGAAVTQSGPRG